MPFAAPKYRPSFKTNYVIDPETVRVGDVIQTDCFRYRVTTAVRLAVQGVCIAVNYRSVWCNPFLMPREEPLYLDCPANWVRVTMTDEDEQEIPRIDL